MASRSAAGESALSNIWNVRDFIDWVELMQRSRLFLLFYGIFIVLILSSIFFWPSSLAHLPATVIIALIFMGALIIGYGAYRSKGVLPVLIIGLAFCGSADLLTSESLLQTSQVPLLLEILSVLLTTAGLCFLAIAATRWFRGTES